MDVLPPPVVPPAGVVESPSVSAAPVATRRAVPGRFLHGRPEEPVWARSAVAALLGATALLYLWSLGHSGWANAYYSAAAQAGSQSWKAFLFGSLDASNAITVDKAPLFLWPMALSARLFGVNPWSILVPQALEGVAAVAVLYLAVKRWAGAAAGLIAGGVLAVTPVAALMFRFNNPDSLLVLLLTVGAYATVRAIESGATRWVVAVGVCVGLGFLAKMLQAFLVVPGFGLAFLVAAPGPLRFRIRQLALAALAMVASAGWWVALVALWPASSRPYIGGSQDNSILNLIFGYNGFGRLTGYEAGSVGGGPVNMPGRWGATGLGRLFSHAFGGQISWLLPAALILGAAVLASTWYAPRTDRARAAVLLWGGWLVITGLAISLGQGIIHEYYTVALAPPIGALIALGAVHLWQRREQWAARAAMAATIAVTAWWASELLSRTPDWHPALRPLVVMGGLVAAVGLLVPAGRRTALAAGAAALAVVVAVAGPTASSWATAATPHSGAIPLAGPRAVGAQFTVIGGRRVAGFGPFWARLGRAFPPGQGQGQVPGPGGGVRGGFPGLGGLAGRGSSVPGGILRASKPDAELIAALARDAGDYRWVAATVSANRAAGYQLATGAPVMAIGGFNGTDPWPTLAQFQKLVAEGKIHWFVAAAGVAHGHPGSTADEIATWVVEDFPSQTVGGATLYDLTSTTGGGA